MEKTTSESCHVVPSDDYFEHSDENCRCRPELREGVWLHHLLINDRKLDRLAEIILDR